MFALPSSAATFVVNSTADTVDVTPGDGICADSGGNCTLRAAVMEADALAGADTIDLTGISDPNTPIILTIKGADETYEAATTGTGYQIVETHDSSIGDLNITGDTTIVGAGSGKTIIEWAAADQTDGTADRIFHIEAVDSNVTVTMSGLTVMNGYTPPVYDIETTADGKIWQFKRFGGGIAIGPSAATALFDPSTEGGGSTGGGGSEGGGGESSFAVTGVTLTDVNVLNCQSGADGGGIYVIAPLTLVDSVISGNVSATNGGGLYLSAATTISGTTIGTVASVPAFINPNHAENGGGIFDTGLHTTTIGSSSIIGNTATGGGALAARSTTIDNFTNSTIANNVAQDVAGGIATNGTTNLTNVTVSDNSVVPTSTSESGGAGAGLYSFGSGSFTSVNSIVSHNTIAGTTTVVSNCGGAGGGAFKMTSSGHNLEDGNTCGFSAAGDLVNTDPKLEALANNGGLTETMAIPQSSPAIDAGDNSVCPNNDQRGELRPADGNLDGTFVCDIGAFELFVHTADLHINNMTAPDMAYATDPITIAIEAHNDPTATTAASGVTITTDPLPAEFTVNSANVTTPGGTSACTVSSNVVTCAVGSLAVGDTATADIEGTDAVPGDLTIVGNVSSTSPVDPITGNNTSQVHIQVVGNSDMGVTASGSATPVDDGKDTDMTFTVNNNGADTANNVRAAAILPDGLTYKSITISQGTCTYSTDDASVTCLIGSMANGASVTGTLTVNGTIDGPVTTSFGVDADERDVNLANDAADVTLTLVGNSDLKLAMTFAKASVDINQAAPMTVVVENLGNTDTTNVKTVLTAPTGLAFLPPSASSGCTLSGNTMTCTQASLAVGSSSTLTVSVMALEAGAETVTGVTSSDRVDPDTSNNSASAKLTAASSGGGGGCVYSPRSPFDPTLPAIFAIGLIGLLIRRSFKKTDVH